MSVKTCLLLNGIHMNTKPLVSRPLPRENKQQVFLQRGPYCGGQDSWWRCYTHWRNSSIAFYGFSYFASDTAQRHQFMEKEVRRGLNSAQGLFKYLSGKTASIEVVRCPEMRGIKWRNLNPRWLSSWNCGRIWVCFCTIRRKGRQTRLSFVEKKGR